jgi:hypothetical protein
VVNYLYELEYRYFEDKNDVGHSPWDGERPSIKSITGIQYCTSIIYIVLVGMSNYRQEPCNYLNQTPTCLRSYDTNGLLSLLSALCDETLTFLQVIVRLLMQTGNLGVPIK